MTDWLFDSDFRPQALTPRTRTPLRIRILQAVEMPPSRPVEHKNEVNREREQALI